MESGWRYSERNRYR